MISLQKNPDQWCSLNMRVINCLIKGFSWEKFWILRSKIYCNVDVEFNSKIDSDLSGEVSGKTRIIDILKTKYRVCSLKSSTTRLFKKVEKLSSCYSKGNHVIVRLKAIFNE